MFEFTKLCARYESLTMLERRELLTEKSAQVIKNLRQLDISDIDPIKTLASFIIGSVVSGSDIDEKEYLLIYPSLVKVFGYDFDFAQIKKSFYPNQENRKQVEKFTKAMLNIMSNLDDEVKADIISLCLLIATTDSIISLKTRHYIRQLCKS